MQSKMNKKAITKKITIPKAAKINRENKVLNNTDAYRHVLVRKNGKKVLVTIIFHEISLTTLQNRWQMKLTKLRQLHIKYQFTATNSLEVNETNNNACGKSIQLKSYMKNYIRTNACGNPKHTKMVMANRLIYLFLTKKTIMQCENSKISQIW